MKVLNQMCSLCLYYKISFGQLSMYVANKLSRIPSSGVDSEDNYSLCHCWQFIEQSPSYFGVSLSRDGEMELKWEMQAPFFLFSNTQVIVRRKQWMLWHKIHDVPHPNTKQKKKKTPSQIKINSETHRMASTMAPTSDSRWERWEKSDFRLFR